jgi:Tfp pilus assembly protein PilF
MTFLWNYAGELSASRTFAMRIVAPIVALVLCGTAAMAEMVDVAPGIQVTKRTYAVPIEQQPFYGFAEKTPEQRAADDNFVAALTAAAGTRQKAFEVATMRGWKAITDGKAGEAALRFNQAFLLAPEQSGVYHGLATVAQMRFKDVAFADELFKIARKQPNPLKSLNADYGRFLLIAKRPGDAKPVLEQAVIDAPDLGDAWSNLAFARFQTGDRVAACGAAEEAAKRKPTAAVNRDLALLRSKAECN